MSPAVPRRPGYFPGAAYGLATVLIWAGWMPLTRLAVTTGLEVGDLVALRFGVAGIVLLPVLLRRGLALRRIGWGGALGLVALAGAPYNLLAATGLHLAPAAHGGVLMPGVMPLFVAVLAAVFLAERPNGPRLFGLGLIAAGVLAIAGVDALAGGALGLGHAMFLMASLSWAGFTVLMRRFGLDPIHAAALVSVGSLVGFTLPWLAWSGGAALLAAPLGPLVLQGLYQGVLATVLSLVLYGRTVAILGASGAAAFGALAPALAALAAIPILGEVPTGPDWLGIGLVTLGVYLASGGPLAARLFPGRVGA